MREFKFRYWNPNKKEMVHPGGLCIVWTGECKRDHVIMQSTGLKDKNGKEIFEGETHFVNEMFEDFTAILS